MGIKEAYLKIKARESRYKSLIQWNQDKGYPRSHVFETELESIRLDLKIIEKECPEVLPKKANEIGSNSNAIEEANNGRD